MNTWHFQLPASKEQWQQVRTGDKVYLTGPVLAARDEAHRRLYDLAQKSEAWPVDVEHQVIYYVGPSPGFGDYAVGAAGPTTSGRMDLFTPMMLECGVAATMGKGYRSADVKAAMLAHQSVYLVATGGAGALLGRRIVKREVLAYDDLGPEAITRLWLKDFPCLVAFDTTGADIYES